MRAPQLINYAVNRLSYNMVSTNHLISVKSNEILFKFKTGCVPKNKFQLQKKIVFRKNRTAKKSIKC